MTTARGGLGARVEGLLAATAVASFARPWRTLALVALVTGASLWQARTLTVNSDMSELLPETFSSVQALHLLEKRFGSIGYAVVAIWGGDGEKLKAMAEELAPVLEALPTVRYVDYTRPTTFLEEHVLYFLEVEDLEEMRRQLEAREAYEKRAANPLVIDLEEEEPPPIDFADLQQNVDARGDRQWVQAQLGETYYFDPDKPMIMLMAKPADSKLDLRYARRLVGDVKAAVDKFDPKRFDAGVSVGYTGRYVKRVDQQDVIQRDLKVATLAALLLVFGYLALHFRRLLATVLILGPLLIGLCWAFGFTALTYGSLNILTAFVASVLIGLGIDNGIHLLARFQAETAKGLDGAEAVRRTFGNTGRGVMVAALTTIAGFASLAPSEFRAFHEFGGIAAAGLALLMAAFFVTLPALLSLATRWGWRPRSEAHQSHGRLLGLIFSRPGRVTLLAGLAILISWVALPQLRFDFDFRALENSDLPSFKLDLETNRLLGYSQTPVVVLTPNEQDERQIARELREQKTRLGDASTIDFIAASVDLVPENQEQKRPAIHAMGEIVARVRPSWLAPALRPYLDVAKRMTKAEPFGFADLPDEVRRQFQGVDAAAGEGFILVYPGISLSDGAATARLAAEVRGVPSLAGRANLVAGEAMILADILDMVLREAPKVIIGALVLIVLISLLMLGNLRDTLVAVGPPLAGITTLLALMPLAGLQLNYLNIVMLPVILGMSVDGGAHMVTRLNSGLPLPSVVAETGRAIGGSILTTAFGYGSMILAHHPGLESLGKMAVLGLAVNLFVCMVPLPAYLAWARGRAAPVSAPPPGAA